MGIEQLRPLSGGGLLEKKRSSQSVGRESLKIGKSRGQKPEFGGPYKMAGGPIKEVTLGKVCRSHENKEALLDRTTKE